jgi:glycosyltransferase involved in cell wall biosynthesis
MHIVLLNQAFAPDVVATAQMSKDLADELVRRGHRVTAVASRSIYGKKGAVLPRREMLDGIDVRRPGVSLFGKAGPIARVIDFGLFYALASLRVLTLDKPDVVVSFTTPPYIAITGIVTRWVRGASAAHWVMDLYPDVMIASGMMKPKGVVTRLLESVSRWAFNHSDINVVLGRCMRDRVLAKGVDASKVVHIPVWADLSGITGIARDQSKYRTTWQLGDAFTVMYSGNLGIGHDAQTMCRAMEILRDRDDIRFVFVGDGKRRKEVEAFIAEKKLTNVRWFAYVPREDLGQSLAAADVHLVSVREGVEGIMVPSKLFGIMAAGRASIYIGNPGSEVAQVLREHDAGVCVREGDAQGLADAIVRMKDDATGTRAMGDRARASVAGRYDKSSACARWAELLEKLHKR